MQNPLTLSHLLLYGYFGLRFTLYSVRRLYGKYENEFEKGDIQWWIIVLLFWPIFFALYVVFGQRGTAVRLALYYGLLPWQYYEKTKHYKGSYLRHAFQNIGYALKWFFFLESKADRDFEREINKNF